MQCRYQEKITYAGDMLFGVVYGAFRKAGARRGRFRESSDVQKKLNDRHAREYLNWLVHANFEIGALAVDPTYDDGCYPETEEQFGRDIRNYLLRVKRLYKAAGVEFKWICVRAYGTETAQNGQSEHTAAQHFKQQAVCQNEAEACSKGNGRLHLHFIFPGGVSGEELRKAWGMGRVNYDLLDFNECGITDKVAYIFDQRHFGKRRWSGSRNLVKPKERSNVNSYSKQKLKDLSDSVMPHKFFADTYPGYALSEWPRVERNPINGSYYMTFMMYKPDGKNLCHYRRRGKNNTKRSPA